MSWLPILLKLAQRLAESDSEKDAKDAARTVIMALSAFAKNITSAPEIKKQISEELPLIVRSLASAVETSVKMRSDLDFDAHMFPK